MNFYFKKLDKEQNLKRQKSMEQKTEIQQRKNNKVKRKSDEISGLIIHKNSYQD